VKFRKDNKAAMQTLNENTVQNQAPLPQRRSGIEIVISDALPSRFFRGSRRARNFSLSDAEKRVVVKSQLKILAWRLDHDIPINSSDIERVLPYVEDGDAA
jgi:hypothetical protein